MSKLRHLKDEPMYVVGRKGGLGRKGREGGRGPNSWSPHACLQSHHHAYAVSMFHPYHGNWQKVGKGGKAARGRGQGGECAVWGREFESEPQVEHLIFSSVDREGGGS